ncbi:non-homologous end-joining DNA ligase [Nocardioidaceae bacterium]|nr:non-homologous end-joining DNA ligase [Nocardioidaceae bacterium]
MLGPPTPGLATLTHDRDWDAFAAGWVVERKLDGQRVLADTRGTGARLWSRNGHDVTDAFPEIVAALGAVPTGWVLDGEVVAFDGAVTSFARLQQRIGLRGEAAASSGVGVFFYVFDVLSAAGEDLRDLPWTERKARLREGIGWSDDKLRLVPHRTDGFEEYYAEACSKGWEGLIAKRADAAYPGGRTKSWLKLKCEAGQELVVVGWSEPRGERVGLGALLLAHHLERGDTDDSALRYVGKVGTGFDHATLRDLRGRLGDLEVGESPCTEGELPRGKAADEVHWVRPELVAEVAFTEWTSDGMMRHPRFLGLRTDKPAADVVRES